jgi:drug/metabolite transporter (DMT)-like permease
MLASVLCLVGMTIGARELSAKMSSVEILSFRAIVGVVVMFPFLLRGGWAAFRTHQFGWHAGRSVLQFAAQFAWVFGIATLPLAEITALEFTIPLWAAPIAILFLGERMAVHKWLALLLGFAGILIILRPGIAVVSPAALVVLAGCLAFAATGVLMKHLARTDDPKLIVFYVNLIQLPMALIPAVYVWVTPNWSDAPWIFLWGFGGLAATYAMAKAMQLADATLILPIDFVRLPFAAFLGYLLYAEQIVLWTLFGALIIFGANYYSVTREARRSRP